MRFVEVATTSAEVARLSGRLDKVGRLADLLTRLAPEEVEPAVAFLSGSIRQGRLGLGHVSARSTCATRAVRPPVSTSKLMPRSASCSRYH